MNTPVPSLSVLALGRVGDEAISDLRAVFAAVEQIDLDLSPSATLEDHAATLNRAIDAAGNDWILVLREREEVDGDLAAALLHAVFPSARSWAFRLKRQPWYDGGPLRLGPDDPGEIRLIHRRHCRWGIREGARELKVQGGVVRLGPSLRVVRFGSSRDHAEHLARVGVPHSFVRRCLVFVGSWLRRSRSKAGLREIRYLWVEAGWDSGKT